MNRPAVAPPNWEELAAVSFGGAIGACLRYGAAQRIGDHWHRLFPLSTLAINLTGSFILAFFLTAIAVRTERWKRWRLFFATGVLGAYTTFSTFSVETAHLLRDHHWLIAGGYIAASLAGGMLAAGLGYLTSERIVVRGEFSRSEYTQDESDSR
ncbi:MAG: fluoride efflux transporter CrcB [Thermomicrobiales bacterium]